MSPAAAKDDSDCPTSRPAADQWALSSSSASRHPAHSTWNLTGRCRHSSTGLSLLLLWSSSWAVDGCASSPPTMEVPLPANPKWEWNDHVRRAATAVERREGSQSHLNCGDMCLHLQAVTMKARARWMIGPSGRPSHASCPRGIRRATPPCLLRTDQVDPHPPRPSPPMMRCAAVAAAGLLPS